MVGQIVLGRITCLEEVKNSIGVVLVYYTSHKIKMNCKNSAIDRLSNNSVC